MHPASLPTDNDLVRARFPIGDFEITICTDGTYLLDGGAMFGVVPKTLWQRRAIPDSENRILLGLNTEVIRTGRHTVVIETGIGNKQSAKMQEIHQHQQSLLKSLEAAGIKPDEGDVVINTHLHFDHCGWNTTLHPDGTVTPTFPNARYFAHAGEVAHGHLQLDRDRVSYLSPNYDPLIASGQMTLLSDEDIDAMHADNLRANSLGINGVPCFVVAGRHAIAGAQEPEVIERLLDVAAVEVSEI